MTDSAFKNFKRRVFSNLPDDWLKLIQTEELDEILKTIHKDKLAPGAEDIFNFARLTPLANVKVCIVGQDPYPKAGDAHGLAFSCLTGVPGSLRNIYKCLVKSKLIAEMPTDGNLESWAKQGVLLINTALTTKVGQSLAHMDIWEYYTRLLISKISEIRPIIFMLWGNKAQELESALDSKSHILTYAHPSPLAQAKASFAECDHFIVCNKLLKRLGHEPIDWNVEEQPSEIEIKFEAGPKTLVVFTDGSCWPNNSSAESEAGYAAVFALGSLKDISLYGNISNRPNYATNNRAEGMAIWKTLIFLKSKASEWEKLIIVSDSEFWINMFEKYMPSWDQKNLFEEKKNPDMTRPMYDLYLDLTDNYGKEIQFRHMKSHGKDGWQNAPEDSYEYFCFNNNKYVDELAAYARTNLPPGEDKIDAVDYSE